MTLKIKNTAIDIPDTEHFSFIVYGPPKTEKTLFAMSAPNALILDFDDGCKHYKHLGVDYITYGPEGHEWMRFEKDIQDIFKNCKWETIVFDSATSMSEVLLRKLLQETGKTQPTRDEYGRRAKIMSDMFSKTTKLAQHKNVIWICHEGETQNEAGSTVKVHPLLPGALKELAGANVDHVFRSRTKSISNKGVATHVLDSRANSLYVQGSRLNLGVLEKPTWACFIEHVKASREAQQQTPNTD